MTSEVMAAAEFTADNETTRFLVLLRDCALRDMLRALADNRVAGGRPETDAEWKAAHRLCRAGLLHWGRSDMLGRYLYTITPLGRAALAHFDRCHAQDVEHLAIKAVDVYHGVTPPPGIGKQWLLASIDEAGHVSAGLREAIAAARDVTKTEAVKPRVDLIDGDFLLALGRVLAQGGSPPGAEWRDGYTVFSQIGPAFRHLLEIMAGRYFDPESGAPHAVHLAARAMFIWYAMHQNPAPAR